MKKLVLIIMSVGFCLSIIYNLYSYQKIEVLQQKIVDIQNESQNKIETLQEEAKMKIEAIQSESQNKIEELEEQKIKLDDENNKLKETPINT